MTTKSPARKWVEAKYPKALEHHKDMLVVAYWAGMEYIEELDRLEAKPDVFCNHHQSHTIDRLHKLDDFVVMESIRLEKQIQDLDVKIENHAGEIVEQHGEIANLNSFKPRIIEHDNELHRQQERITKLESQLISKGLIANMTDRITFLEATVAGLVQKCEKQEKTIDKIQEYADHNLNKLCDAMEGK